MSSADKAISNFLTQYGIVSLYSNDTYITSSFKNGHYWDEDTLLKLKTYIPSDKNILEIGGHCGTSSLVYATFLSDKNQCYVYEPQHKMYELLTQNIKQNI